MYPTWVAICGSGGCVVVTRRPAPGGLVSTTIRSRPTRATSTATGRAPDDDRCSETVPPGSTDCGQQYPVTVSRGIGRTLITGLETGRGLPDRPPIDLRSTADGG